MYENQRRNTRLGASVLIAFLIGVQVLFAILYAKAPERSKQSICAEVLSPSDLTCSVQSTWSKGSAGAWWGGVDGALLFIGLALNKASKKK